MRLSPATPSAVVAPIPNALAIPPLANAPKAPLAGFKRPEEG